MEAIAKKKNQVRQKKRETKPEVNKIKKTEANKIAEAEAPHKTKPEVNKIKKTEANKIAKVEAPHKTQPEVNKIMKTGVNKVKKAKFVDEKVPSLDPHANKYEFAARITEDAAKWENEDEYYADLLKQNEAMKKKMIKRSLKLCKTVQHMMKHDIYAYDSTFEDIAERHDMKEKSHSVKSKAQTVLNYIKKRYFKSSRNQVIEPM